ncbi:MAG: DPP IV N-terminal domain-containing protein [Verrucomicrobia bacterium]|nr:DPP IV N-terminal domain-containing protein [Verrucomicrobiota bacterium]
MNSIMLRVGWAVCVSLGLWKGQLLAADASSGPGDPWLRALSATRNFQLGRPVRPVFLPDGGTVLFLRSGPRSPEQGLYAMDTASGTTREFLQADALLAGAPDQVSTGEQARRERQRITAGGLVGFALSTSGSEILVPLSGRLHRVDAITGTSAQLPVAGPVTDAQWAPDGRQVSYIRDHDLWVFDLARGREHRITRGGTAEVTHGEAEFVAQEEMDRSTGYWWSPDGRHLVFEEADHRGVEVWRVLDPFQPGSDPAPQFYPRPGHPNVSVRLGIVGSQGGTPRWITWDRARWPYLARVQWHRTGGLTLTVQSRDQRELVVLRADPKSGRTSVLWRETDAAWVNLDQSVPLWTRDGRQFLWTSERSGRWELELRNAGGALERVLVPGVLGWKGLVHWDEDRGTVWFHASDDPTQQQVWRMTVPDGTPEQLTHAAGWHVAAKPSRSGHWMVTSVSAAALATTEVHRPDGTTAGQLPSVAEEPARPIRAAFVRVGTGEGWFAKLVRPADFTPGRKYPVLVSVYGGPHAQVVRQSLAASLTDQWLADRGFVVVAMDGRGTPGRGRDWERALFGKLGPVPLEEQAAALEALGGRYPELDLDHVGITGWSFGGYLSAYAVLRRPDRFHAAVAGAPVTDWDDYDTHYTERYLGVPPGPAVEAAYRESSCLPWAKELHRPLLLIHGTRDDNVFFRHTLRLTDALLRAGRPFEVLPLPGFTHMIPDPVIAEQRWQRTADFFERHLKPGRTAPGDDH